MSLIEAIVTIAVWGIGITVVINIFWLITGKKFNEVQQTPIVESDPVFQAFIRKEQVNNQIKKALETINDISSLEEVSDLCADYEFGELIINHSEVLNAIAKKRTEITNIPERLDNPGLIKDCQIEMVSTDVYDSRNRNYQLDDRLSRAISVASYMDIFRIDHDVKQYIRTNNDDLELSRLLFEREEYLSEQDRLQ